MFPACLFCDPLFGAFGPRAGSPDTIYRVL